MHLISVKPIHGLNDSVFGAALVIPVVGEMDC